MKKIIILSVLLAISALNISCADNVKTSEVPVSLITKVVTVPAGNTFRGISLANISSESAYTGQEISLALASDFIYNQKLIAPAGSLITGTVIEVAKAKHGSIKGKLTLRFTHIMTPSGDDIPISAVINTEDKTGTIYGKDKLIESEEYLNILNADNSTAINHINSPMKTGENRLVGSGGGMVKSIWDKGAEVIIPVNKTMELILTQPITVSPSNYENK